MPFVEVPDARIYYELHGPEPGVAPAIVFAHGAGGNHLSWWQQVPHFRRTFTCVTFDHRGFGRSIQREGGPGSAAFADDLRALLDHIGIERASLVAQSMGGWTCLRFAIESTERVAALVMCDTHGGLRSDEIAAAFASHRMPDVPEGVHVAAGARMASEQPLLHFLYREIDALNAPRTRDELGALLRSAGAPACDAASLVRLPVLFVVGEEDPLIPPSVIEAAARCFPDARVARVPEAGHSVYFERPDAFNALLERFLASRVTNS